MCCVCFNTKTASPETLHKEGLSYLKRHFDCYKLKGLKLLKKAADRGNYEACYDLAMRIENFSLPTRVLSTFLKLRHPENYDRSRRLLFAHCRVFAKTYLVKAQGEGSRVSSLATSKLEEFEIEKESPIDRQERLEKESEQRRSEESKAQQKLEAAFLKSIDGKFHLTSYGSPRY